MEIFNRITARIKIGDIVTVASNENLIQVEVVQILSVEPYGMNNMIEFIGKRINL